MSTDKKLDLEKYRGWQTHGFPKKKLNTITDNSTPIDVNKL